jgi:WD40 repeat protein
MSKAGQFFSFLRPWSTTWQLGSAKLFAVGIFLASTALTDIGIAQSAKQASNLGASATKSTAKKSSAGIKKSTTAAKQAVQTILSPMYSFQNNTLPNSAHPAVNSVAVSPDGAHLVAGTQDGMVKLWDISTGSVRFTMKDHRQSSIGGNKFQSPARAVAYSPDGKSIVSGSDSGAVVFDTQTGNEIRTYNTHFTAALAFSPDGQTIAAASAEGQMNPNHAGVIQIMDANSSAILITIPGITGGVTSIVFSPDGKTLATAGANGEVILWQVSNGQKLGNFDTHSVPGNVNYARSVAFSPDGLILATGGGTNTPWQGALRLWNVQSGTLIKTINDGQPIQSVAFSHDGTKIAAANWDKSIKVYGFPSLNLAATTKVFLGGWSAATASDGHAGAVNSVVFSPNDKVMYSGGGDHFIKGWHF